jgi:hypothetical protein
MKSNKKTRKQSAIQRELDIVIVLNTTPIRDKEEMDNLDGNIYTIEGQYVTGGGIEKIREGLEKDKKNAFLVKERDNIDNSDAFEQILDYMMKTKMCVLGKEFDRYIEDSIYYSDFVIFINNGFISDGYKPMCIAFINIYKQRNNKFLFISLICSDPTMGQCGSFLMDTIKYVSTLLNCNEIRLDSVSERNTYEFYAKNGFININDKPLLVYTHYYPIIPDDAEFKRPQIEGQINHPSNQWFYKNGLVKYNDEYAQSSDKQPLDTSSQLKITTWNKTKSNKTKRKGKKPSKTKSLNKSTSNRRNTRRKIKSV